MPKSRLIEVKLLDKILDFFGNSDADTKQKFLGSIEKSDPTMAKAFNNWETDFVDLLQATRRLKIKNKQNTDSIDALIRKVKS